MKVFKFLFVLALLIHLSLLSHAQQETDSRLHAVGRKWGFYQAADTLKSKRVLLTGDSILGGYWKIVSEAFKDSVAFDYWINPYHEGDPVLFRELSKVMAHGPYDVIHFNIGLHGWQKGRVDDAKYELIMQRYIDVLKAGSPNARIIWATTTPVTEKNNPSTLNDTINPVIVRRNNMANAVMKKNKVAINDLYGLMLKNLSMARGDMFHWKPGGVQLQAQAVIKSIQQNLQQVAEKPQAGSQYTPAGFKNDICLPGTLYMLEDVQNDIFVEPLTKRWRPYDDVVRFSGSAEYSRRLTRVASVRNPKNGTTIQLDLVNTDAFESIKKLSANIVVGKPGTGKDTVTVSIIGDSFTDGGFFIDALLKKNYVPQIKMTGLKNVRGYPGQYDEGRGGWTLAGYFRVSTERDRAYNGFWQPEGNYRYWGATAFWKLAFEVKNDPKKMRPNGENWKAARFETALRRFDPATCYLLSPAKNDLMYDNTAGHYVLYDGKKWNKAAYEDFNWSFNYGKYLAMWNLQGPEILAEFLGLNDFRNAPDPATINFTQWNEQMEQVIAAYLQAVPGGKFVLMIPSSSCGIMDNQRGDFTIKQNACMWELRKNIIEHFDNRTKEHIYLVDAAIAIDNVYGTRFLTDSLYTQPYAGYEGAERYPVQYGNPHPYPNYPTMGISLAAFIQRFRKL